MASPPEGLAVVAAEVGSIGTGPVPGELPTGTPESGSGAGAYSAAEAQSATDYLHSSSSCWILLPNTLLNHTHIWTRTAVLVGVGRLGLSDNINIIHIPADIAAG